MQEGVITPCIHQIWNGTKIITQASSNDLTNKTKAAGFEVKKGSPEKVHQPFLGPSLRPNPDSRLTT